MKTRGGHRETARFYNISNFPVDELIDIDLNQNIDGSAYLKHLDDLNAKCSRGGAIHTPNIITTFDDDVHPGTIVRYKGKWKSFDVTTCFLIRKADLYLCCHCHEANFLIASNWFELRGSMIKIEGAMDAKYAVNYDDAKALQTLLMSIDQDLKFLVDHIGKDAVLCGLWCLRYGNFDEKRLGYQAIAHNLCEPSRLTIISKLVCDTFDTHVTTPLGEYQALFQKWAKLYRLVRSPDDPSFLSSLKMYHKFGIKDYQDLLTSIKIMLKQNERKRNDRKIKLVKCTGDIALKFFEKSIGAKIRRGKVKWKSSISPAKLAQVREAELLRRINSGGDPGIWRSLHKCLREKDLRYARLIIRHTDINPLRHDLRVCVDDRGEIYRLQKKHMLSDPCEED